MADDASGYIVTVYTGRGMPPDRSEFEDKARAEKAFNDAKFAAVLWQNRSVGNGLGWIKLKEKDAPIAPPPAAAAPAAAAKPAAPAAPPPAK